MYILAKAVFSTLLDASERVYQLRAFNEQQIIRFTACSGIAMSVCGFAALSILALPVLFILPALMRRFTIRQILVAGNLIAMVAGVVGFLFYNWRADYFAMCGIQRILRKAPYGGTLGSVVGFAKNIGAALGTFLMGVSLTVICYDGGA